MGGAKLLTNDKLRAKPSSNDNPVVNVTNTHLGNAKLELIADRGAGHAKLNTHLLASGAGIAKIAAEALVRNIRATHLRKQIERQTPNNACHYKQTVQYAGQSGISKA